MVFVHTRRQVLVLWPRLTENAGESEAQDAALDEHGIQLASWLSLSPPMGLAGRTPHTAGTNEAQKPVPYRRLADSVGASRTRGNASYRLCAQIKEAATHRTDCVRRLRMSAESDGVTGWSGVPWQASWKIRVSSVGSRDTL